jgi:hypothetical protein
MLDSTIPPILRTIMDNATRPRSAKESEAARRFVLGQSTIAEYLAALGPNNDKRN